MNYLEQIKIVARIRKMMTNAGLDSISFVYHNNKPIITKDYQRYEIYIISQPSECEDTITVGAICYSPYGIYNLTIDSKSRKSTWNMIEKVVKREIARMGLND